MPVVINGTTGITTPTESVATTIGVGGATPSASGAGITFPATASLSTNANTLDDYEEGTWTPTLTGSGGAPTISYAVRTGSYIKIGRMVTVFVTLRWTSLSGGSGVLLINNLPFVGAADSDECGGTIGLTVGWTTPAVQVQVDSTSANLYFFRNTANTNSPIGDIGSGSYLNCSICYTTDS